MADNSNSDETPRGLDTDGSERLARIHNIEVAMCVDYWSAWAILDAQENV